MKLKEFEEYVETLNPGYYLVSIKMKYNCQEKYEYLNQLLVKEANSGWYWEIDWHEGQQDVNILGVISIDQIIIPNNFIEENKNV